VASKSRALPTALRRQFQRGVLAIPALLFFATHAGGSPLPQQPPATPEVLNVLKTAVFSGEPYELRGKRMVFTSWYFIRPGVLLWLNKEGEYVNTKTEQVYGPWAN